MNDLINGEELIKKYNEVEKLIAKEKRIFIKNFTELIHDKLKKEINVAYENTTLKTEFLLHFFPRFGNGSKHIFKNFPQLKNKVDFSNYHQKESFYALLGKEQVEYLNDQYNHLNYEVYYEYDTEYYFCFKFKVCEIENFEIDNFTGQLIETDCEQIQCLICKTYKKNVALNCGHLLCPMCVSKISKCPFCETKIGRKQKVFI